ncbi:MAG: prepilin-type N-terminal cleavage/methylation domain-containing protein [Patescibacteria group bacterium]|nr:prepilin-type N-terminal cleavage/methylation domain-containing protein [Patescibacteria group bacterium]
MMKKFLKLNISSRVNTSKTEKKPVPSNIEGACSERAKRVEGFTLVEMVVAMTLFVAVVVTVMSLFLRSVQAERGIAGKGSTIGSVSLAIEEIAREMRTANGFILDGTQLTTSTQECGKAYNSITFTYVNGFGSDTTVAYSLSTPSGGGNAQITQSINNQPALPMTPAGTNISSLQFIVSNNSGTPGNCNGRQLPPRITITAEGENPANAETGFVAPFDLQTTVSQRLYYYH